MLLNNEWVKMRLGKKSKSFWKQMKMNSQQSKIYGYSKGSPEREVHSNTGGLPRKDRNIANKQPNPTSTQTRETATNKAQSQ